mgnify:CR=1 FL=1
MTKIIEKDPQKTLEFNPDKCSEILGQLIETFKNRSPTVNEILVIYGNLGYSLGAAIEGYKDKGPSIKELQEKYYKNPTVGAALMLQGVEVTGWYKDYEKQTIKEMED